MTIVMGVMNQLRIHGEKIEDKELVEIFISSLSKKIEMVVITIEVSKDLPKITIKEFMGSILSHESLINMKRNTWDMPSSLRQ